MSARHAQRVLDTLNLKMVRLRYGFMLLLSLLALATMNAHAMTWAPCDEGARPVSVDTVMLSPDPPVIGSPATFIVQGSTSVGVQTGNVDIAVSFGGIEIFAESEDLCTKTKCPVAPGGVSITLVEYLPPIAPPGPYGLRVTAQDGSGANELLCLDVQFELVLPGGMSSA